MATECTVCFEPYTSEGEKQPKLLHCTHTLCLQCVEQLVMGTTLMCPECRKDHRIPQGKADALPTNR